MTRRLAHTKRLGWGILGAGKIAATFAEDLHAAGMHVAAVGSRDIHRARQFAAAARIDKAHGSYESLCEDREVDVVYIATPQAFHAEQSLLAIEHHKPILVEKSFTVTEAEARRVASAAQAAEVFVMEALWTRFLPSMLEVRRRIAAGAIGEVVAVNADHHQRLSADPDNRHYDPALSGGALLDLGVYPVNLAVELLGPVTSHRSLGRLSERGVDTRVVTLLAHAGGGLTNTSTAIDLPGAVRAQIVGTDGFIELDQWWFQSVGWSRWDAGRPGRLVERFDPPPLAARGMYLQAREVERCVRAGLLESPVMPVAESIEVVRVLDAIRHELCDNETD